MSNEITVPGVSTLETLSAVRTSKSGKETTRSVIGMAISGNREERANLSFAIAEEFWFAKANIFPFVTELNRVFPTLKKTLEVKNEVIKQFVADNPGTKMRLVNIGAPNKLDVLAMFLCARGLQGSDKGAKAQLLAVMQHLADMEDDLTAAKAARAAAFAATQVLTTA